MKKQMHKLLIENTFSHKESIEPSLFSSIQNKVHYNANNSIYPELVGRNNYLEQHSTNYFTNALNKIKRVSGIDNIEPKKYFELKKATSKLLRDMYNIEEKHFEKLSSLAENLIRSEFDVPNNIRFSINGDEVDEFDGTNVLEIEKNGDDILFDDYSGIQGANKTIDRQRMNYCLICGGSNYAMGLYNTIEQELDSIDYKLFDMYNKFNSFNSFNLWVTPDEIISKGVDSPNDFKIYDDGEGYIVLINAKSFLSMLYEMAKAILSILFQEKYNNKHIDYDNVWNTRIGTIVWDKFQRCANEKKNFPYVIDSMNDLDDDDYTYIMQEALSETEHSKNIFSELYKTF